MRQRDRLAQRVIGEPSAAQRVAFELAVVQGHPGRHVAASLGIKLHAAYALIADVRQQVDDALVTEERRPKIASVEFGWFRDVLTRGRVLGQDRVALPGAALGVVLAVGIPPSVPMDTVSAPPEQDEVRVAEAMPASQPTLWEPDIVIIDEDDPDIIILDDEPARRGRASRDPTSSSSATSNDLLAALEAFEPTSRTTVEPPAELFPETPPPTRRSSCRWTHRSSDVSDALRAQLRRPSDTIHRPITTSTIAISVRSVRFSIRPVALAPR